MCGRFTTESAGSPGHSVAAFVMTVFSRIIAYFSHRPRRGDVVFFAWTLPIWAGATYAFMAATGFFRLATYDFTIRHLLIWSGIYWLMPALLEEAVYRPPFYPLTTRIWSRQFWLLCVLSTAVFVAAHPVNAWLFMRGDFPVFSDWRFLTAVAGLGVYCSILLVRSKCVYFGIVAHYLMVMAWKFALCGHYVGRG
jgi:predicted Abi (CAAX) family protease